ALPGAARLVVGQLVGHELRGVEHATDDDRRVGVALEEADEHLLADARDDDHAISRAGPALAHADPAGAVLIVLALPVPGHMEPDTPELVDVDLLARRPHDLGALHVVEPRLRRLQLWTIGHIGEHRSRRDAPLVLR